MDKSRKEIASKRLKDLRKLHNYTMEQLAEIIGVSKSTIAKWENGYVENMRQDKVAKLASLYDVAPSFIMGFEEKSNSDNTEKFTYYYSLLSTDQKTIIDNLLTTLVSGQSTPPASQE